MQTSLRNGCSGTSDHLFLSSDNLHVLPVPVLIACIVGRNLATRSFICPNASLIYDVPVVNLWGVGAVTRSSMSTPSYELYVIAHTLNLDHVRDRY